MPFSVSNKGNKCQKEMSKTELLPPKKLRITRGERRRQGKTNYCYTTGQLLQCGGAGGAGSEQSTTDRPTTGVGKASQEKG